MNDIAYGGCLFPNERFQFHAECLLAKLLFFLFCGVAQRKSVMIGTTQIIQLISAFRVETENEFVSLETLV